MDNQDKSMAEGSFAEVEEVNPKEVEGEVLRIDDIVQTPEDVQPNDTAEGPLTAEDIPKTEAQKQAEEHLRKLEEGFKAQLAKIEEDLNAKVSAGQMLPEARDIILRAERLKLDKDLLNRAGVVQISYNMVWNMIQTFFEFSTLLEGGRVKALRMNNNPIQGTIDVLFCHGDLEPLAEGETPPYVQMPQLAFNDFQLLMAIRKKDPKLMQNTLRAAGWMNINVTDHTPKIIVPGNQGGGQ